MPPRCEMDGMAEPVLSLLFCWRAAGMQIGGVEPPLTCNDIQYLGAYK